MSRTDETKTQAQDAEQAPSDTFRSVLHAAVVLLLTLLAFAGVKSYRDLSLVRAQERDLREHIEQTESSIRQLTERVERIRQDPAMLEQLAREELGWVRSRDLVIVLPDETSDIDPASSKGVDAPADPHGVADRRDSSSAGSRP